ELPEEPAEPQARLAVSLRPRPGQSGPQVIVLSLQPVQPSGLALAVQVALRLFGQRQVPVAVLPTDRFRLPARLQAAPRELPDRLQHPEAGLTTLAFALAEETLVHQRGERVPP